MLMFDQMKPFIDELVELSCKLKKRHIYGLRGLIAVTYCYNKENMNRKLSLRSETKIRKI